MHEQIRVPGRKVSGALKIVHEKYQKTDLYSSFLEQFSDAVTKNEFIEAHLRKAGFLHHLFHSWSLLHPFAACSFQIS